MFKNFIIKRKGKAGREEEKEGEEREESSKGK